MKTKLRSDWLLLITYIYFFLPGILFVFLWLKWYIGLPLGLFLLFGMGYAWYQDHTIEKPGIGKKLWPLLVLALLILLLWVLSSGIGGAVEQMPDHLYRNGIFKLLTENPWPVRSVVSDGRTQGLVYYIGYWLPAALFAKGTSIAAGMVFQQIWAVLGLFLVWFYVCEKQKKYRLWYLVVFIFFGGADLIGRLMTGGIYTQRGNGMEWWAVLFNYPSVSTQLFWAFNQAIYAWLMYCLIMRQKNNKSILLIWSISLITCPFPAVGMVPFAVYRSVINVQSEEKGTRLRSWFRSIFSLNNLAGFLFTLLMAAYQFSNNALVHTVGRTSAGNAAGTAGEYISIGTYETLPTWPFMTRLWIFLWFALLEFGLYFILLYRNRKKDPLYWISALWLLICPWITLGKGMDFCMRASIPALFCLYVMVLEELEKYWEKRRYLSLVLLLLLLGVSSGAAIDVMQTTMTATAIDLAQESKVPADLIEEELITTGWNFSGSTDSFFYKYLAGGDSNP